MAVEHAAHAAASHGGGDALPELPNFITLLSHRWHDVPVVAFLHHWENLVFALAMVLLLSLAAWRYSRRPAKIPGRAQSLMEMLVQGLDGLVCGVIGPEGRRYTPLIGTLFLYIWAMNLAGMVPGFKSPTSSLNTTVGLAAVVFLYVQWTGMRQLGVVGYLDHLAGQPRDIIGFLLSPLMFVLHVIGEIIKPISLSLRLCFNVFAEDVLLAVLAGLGITLALSMHLPLGIPLQLLAFPLVLIFSTVQALVFSLLSAVYIALMLPHEEHHTGAGAHPVNAH